MNAEVYTGTIKKHCNGSVAHVCGMGTTYLTGRNRNMKEKTRQNGMDDNEVLYILYLAEQGEA